MRLLVARCEVTYSGRLTAVLPEAVRLLILKSDGSVLVHDDTGGYKPLNRIRTEFRAAAVKSPVWRRRGPSGASGRESSPLAAAIWRSARPSLHPQSP